MTLFRRLLALTAAAVALVTAGCANVQPWERGTLADYTAHRRFSETETVSPPSVFEDARSVEELTRLEDELPESALVEAQSRFNELMG